MYVVSMIGMSREIWFVYLIAFINKHLKCLFLLFGGKDLVLYAHPYINFYWEGKNCMKKTDVFIHEKNDVFIHEKKTILYMKKTDVFIHEKKLYIFAYPLRPRETGKGIN